MFNSSKVLIDAKEYEDLLTLKSRVDVLRSFYLNQPAALENHVTINSIFRFDALGAGEDLDIIGGVR